MSKGKKSTAKSAPAQDSNWEETLKGDKLVQVCARLIFVSNSDDCVSAV